MKDPHPPWPMSDSRSNCKTIRTLTSLWLSLIVNLMRISVWLELKISLSKTSITSMSINSCYLCWTKERNSWRIAILFELRNVLESLWSTRMVTILRWCICWVFVTSICKSITSALSIWTLCCLRMIRIERMCSSSSQYHTRE